MRFTAILYMMIVLTPAVCAAQQDSRLEGCMEPKVIARVLNKMRQDKSRLISEQQFRGMWPTELSDVEVGSKTSRTLQSNDRILKGHYQCSEDFTFNVHQEGGVARLELRSITVNYSAPRRGRLLTMAKLFARTVGLGEGGVKTIGAEGSQDYQWEKTEAQERRLYSIDLRFTREDGLWKMYFNASFYVIEG